MRKKAKPFSLFGVEHTTKLCPSCNASMEFLRTETLLPIAVGARAPLDLKRRSVCFDCAAAGTLLRTGFGGLADASNDDTPWQMARIAVANDRQEKLRLPGVPIGIPFVIASKRGDLKRLHEWQKTLVPEEEWK